MLIVARTQEDGAGDADRRSRACAPSIFDDGAHLRAQRAPCLPAPIPTTMRSKSRVGGRAEALKLALERGFQPFFRRRAVGRRDASSRRSRQSIANAFGPTCPVWSLNRDRRIALMMEVGVPKVVQSARQITARFRGPKVNSSTTSLALHRL